MDSTTIDQARGAVAVKMASDLKMPLHELIDDLDGITTAALSPENALALQSARELAGTLLFRLNNLVDLVASQESALELVPEPFSLRAMLRVLKSVITVKAQQRGTEFLLHIDDKVPDRLYGDPRRLAQAILNLVENSLAFTVNGAIILFVEAAHVLYREVQLRISASDSAEGIGTDEEMQFSSRAEAQNFMVRHYKHSGLGLALAYEIVTAMGGKLLVKRLKSQGSSFKFTANIGVQHWYVAPIRKKPTKIVARLHSLRIVVVDDQLSARKLLQHVLERCGHTVSTFASGQEILENFSVGDYDLIFMDLKMPIMSGFDATSEIRKLEKGTNIRSTIIAVSASPYEVVWDQCQLVGIDDFIGKPVDSEIIKNYLGYCEHDGVIA